MANDRRANDPTTPSQVGGGINPSAPTQGTEGPSTNLGNTNRGDNASMRQTGGEVRGRNERSATSSGVGPTGMNPSTAGNNPTANRPGTEGGGQLTFRCADVGHKDCPWQTSGRNEDEIRQRVGEHGREHHGLKEWTNETWDRVRGAIRRAAA